MSGDEPVTQARPSNWRRSGAYLIVLLGAVWTLAPLYWMFITAFKSWEEVVGSETPTLLPNAWSLSGFEQALGYGAQGIADSAIVALGTAVLSLVLGVPAAYSFSRFRTGGRNLAFAVLMVRFMPPVAFTAAVYLIAVRLGLLDTHALLILVNSLFNVPFVVWIMKGFFDEIPYAIEEAAYVDGAGWLRAMRDHVLPLAKPGLVAVGCFVTIFAWNELLFATILTGRHVIPFTRVVPGLQMGRKYLLLNNWPAACALGVLNVVVVILISFYIQRYLVRAMTYGAVWGGD